MFPSPVFLRAVAVMIAVLAWLDPSYAGRGRPRVAVIDAAAGDDLAAQLTAALGGVATVTQYRDPDADVWLVAARDQEALVPVVPPGVSLSLVTPATPATSLVVESLDAPARIGPEARAPVVATVAASGMRGASSTLTVRSGALVLARQTHRWTRDEERLTTRFDVLLPREGVNHLIVEAIDGPGRSRQSRADTAIVVDPAPLSVLVYDGRPSWTTTFARRTLENDARFAVTHAARVSRGLTATTRSAVSPTQPDDRLTADLLAAQTIVIAGAPETLSAGEVEALRAFAADGGALVLAPDQRPTGPYESLLWRTHLEERLLDEPTALPLTDAPELALLASELIDAPVLPAGGRALAGAGPAAASIWTAPLGRGRVLFVGALDAWRFRGRRGDAFDRWWPQVVEWLGRDLVPALRIDVEPRAAAPGDPVTVRVRRRGVADGSARVGSMDAGPLDVRLRVQLRPTAVAAGSAVGSGDTGRTGEAAREEAIRVWPDAEPGVFTARLNAPQQPGVYAVSATNGPVEGDDHGAARAPLIVDGLARRARAADDRWRLATTARGGGVATAAEADRVRRAATPRTDRPHTTERRHPMRSLWWLLPFTAALGGEWLLRRRAGLR